MPKIPGPKVRVIAIKTVVVVMLMVIGRPMVRPMPWMPISSRAFQLTSLKGINQGYLVKMSIGLTKLSQKTKLRKCSL